MNHDAKPTAAKMTGRKRDLADLKNPLDLIAEDHMIEREVCSIIDAIVSGVRVDECDLARVVAYLSDRLPMHRADAETDLFPLMMRRCEPDDEIGTVIDKLRADHRHAHDAAPAIIAMLEQGPGAALSDAARARLKEYALQARRHLSAENAIILPIARARLSRADLDRMRQHMLERRGLSGDRRGDYAE